MPLAWIAVGDPARILPPDRHDEIWAVQGPLNFPQWVYGFDRDTPDLMVQVTRRLSDALGAHSRDIAVNLRSTGGSTEFAHNDRISVSSVPILGLPPSSRIGEP